MTKKPDSPREYKVGDRMLVNLHRDRIEQATITAIIERTSGKKLQVDFDKDRTALIDLWQVVERGCSEATSEMLQGNDILRLRT